MHVNDEDGFRTPTAEEIGFYDQTAAKFNELTKDLCALQVHASTLAVQAAEGDQDAVEQIQAVKNALGDTFTEAFPDDEDMMPTYIMYLINLIVGISHDRLQSSHMVEAAIRSLAHSLPRNHELSSLGDPEAFARLYQATTGRVFHATTFTTDTGQRVHMVHALDDCEGPFCVIHRPCPGPWDLWATRWRDENSTAIPGVMFDDNWRGMERICPHGVGHPAVEEYLRGTAPTSHACCGLCPCSPDKCDPIYAEEPTHMGDELVGFKAPKGNVDG